MNGGRPHIRVPAMNATAPNCQTSDVQSVPATGQTSTNLQSPVVVPLEGPPVPETRFDIEAETKSANQTIKAAESNASPSAQWIGVGSNLPGRGLAATETQPESADERVLPKSFEKRKSEKPGFEAIHPTFAPGQQADRVCYMVMSANPSDTNVPMRKFEPQLDGPVVIDAGIVGENSPAEQTSPESSLPPDNGAAKFQLPESPSATDDVEPIRTPVVVLKPVQAVERGSTDEVGEFLSRALVAVVLPGKGKPSTVGAVGRNPIRLAPGLLDKRLVPLLAIPGELVRMGRNAISQEARSEATPPGSDRTAVEAASASESQTSESLKLDDYEVTRFEFKTEYESPAMTAIQQGPVLQMMKTAVQVREVKPGRLMDSDIDSQTQESGAQSQALLSPATVLARQAVEQVHLVFEPPPTPPAVRSVSMDIGEADSQVRVVIRERNGSLNIQFGSANDRLRQDLQLSGPLLMRELQRQNHPTVTLDFTNFGSATESDRQPRARSQAKKSLKSGAEFAGAAESTYLPVSDPLLKSL